MKELSIKLQFQMLALINALSICKNINEIYELQDEAKQLIIKIEAEYEAQA